MAVIHKTTLTPGKLVLLSAWLPSQPWYPGGPPDLVKCGGFRLDDPTGAVGIEFMLVADSSGDGPAVYHVPLTYRAPRWPGPTTPWSARRSMACLATGGSTTESTILC
jgi:hypothetical protein